MEQKPNWAEAIDSGGGKEHTPWSIEGSINGPTEDTQGGFVGLTGAEAIGGDTGREGVTEKKRF